MTAVQSSEKRFDCLQYLFAAEHSETLVSTTRVTEINNTLSRQIIIVIIIATNSNHHYNQLYKYVFEALRAVRAYLAMCRYRPVASGLALGFSAELWYA